ncbi:hypothetical protein SM007_24520 [Streptomyces avermitilis]|uniref:Uncharacterized protein n=1 Tax=Streptomyces avermitilis TaxID=33903 RepID=A0A4D4M7Q2_STRAX|nr:hypothetical protein [Streptomyces avermitilis]OOV26180.1 hypothetical protein SM007_24520 [Streptomyces avermitilis]GDY67834.1 hypothetical protein SAV14893_072270 [Streptomyces avermitilis]GDY71844.1 hypothetical protein SAV31267_013290 [Streptomyces avermitilis]
MTDRPVDARVLINQVEGHLLFQAALAEGRAEAARFARPLAWLTDRQREEVEARFTEQYLALARDSWERTAQRGAELRTEYEETYRALRRRVCAGILLGAACAAAAALLVVAAG